MFSFNANTIILLASLAMSGANDSSTLTTRALYSDSVHSDYCSEQTSCGSCIDGNCAWENGQCQDACNLERDFNIDNPYCYSNDNYDYLRPEQICKPTVPTRRTRTSAVLSEAAKIALLQNSLVFRIPKKIAFGIQSTVLVGQPICIKAWSRELVHGTALPARRKTKIFQYRHSGEEVNYLAV